MKLEEEEGYRVWTLDERDNVQELGILNPADPERKLSFMADVPHALKNLRNYMLEKGYKLPSVTIVERGKIVEAYHRGGVIPAWVEGKRRGCQAEGDRCQRLL